MGSCAGRGREAEEAAAVARTTALTPVTVDGSLKLTWGAQAFPLTLIWVQVFHVSKRKKQTHTKQTREHSHDKN